MPPQHLRQRQPLRVDRGTSGQRLGRRIERDDAPVGVHRDQPVAHGRRQRLQPAAQAGFALGAAAELGLLGGEGGEHVVERRPQDADLVRAVDLGTAA